MKQFFNRNKILIGSLVFLIVYSVALITFATPPGSPYTAGETLDPTCSPIDTNCFVSIFPDQTGNNGKYLVTNGSNISWASVTAGTVTSVGLSMPTGFSVASSPVTGNGTLEVTTILDGVVIGAGGGFSTATVLTPLSYSAGTLSINNASADGSTKGAATYLASDFDSSGGLISIDYANGQTASGSTKGFLAAADWTTFNNKLTSTLADGRLFIGNGSNIATAQLLSGDATISNTGVLTISSNAIGTSEVTDGSIANTDLANSSINFALGTSGSDANLSTSSASLGGTLTINLPTASSSNRGLLSSTDWTTFNNKIGSLNGLTASSQTFAVGTSGSDFNISSSVSTHTFNLPDAGAGARGLVTTGAQTFAGTKTFSSAPVFSTMTSGSVLFAGTSGALTQNNSNLFWDNTNTRLGLGTNSPSSRVHIKGIGNTSSTSSLIVANSDGTVYEQFRDDGAWSIGRHGYAGGGQSTLVGGNGNVSISSYMNGTGGIGVGGVITSGVGATSVGANVSGYYAIGIGGYNTTVTGDASVGIGMGSIVSASPAIMIGATYQGSFTNSIANTIAFGTGYSSAPFVATPSATPTVYFHRDSGIIMRSWGTVSTSTFDRLSGNAVTSYIFNPYTSSISITSVTNTSGIAQFNFASISAPILAAGDEVTLSGFSNYTNGTYYISVVSSTSFRLHTSRANALALTSYVTYSANDTGTVDVHNRRPTASFTDAIMYYPDDITAGQASPHFLTEDGAIIGLGSGKFGLRSNNDLNLTANDVVGATLKASNNFFGIGDTTPDYLLDVENTGVDGNIFALHDSDGECLHNPEAGSETVTCSSDERLKTNISDASSMLPYLAAFHIRQYDVIASNDHLTGVIAQEVQQLYPDLVTVADNGYLSVASPNTWQLIKAIQELDIKLEPLTSLDLNTSGSFSSLIKQYLESVTNGLTKIFTGEVHTDLLCVGQTCVTESQLQTLLNQQNNNTSTTGDGTTGGGTGDTPQDTTAPVVTLTGDSSIQLTVGDTYTEQGATATDDTDGDITANIQISGTVDTTTVGTYTVTYTVTDMAGNVGEATRVVVVG